MTDAQTKAAAEIAQTGLQIAGLFIPGAGIVGTAAPLAVKLFFDLYGRFKNQAAAEGVTIEELRERLTANALNESAEDVLNKVRAADPNWNKA